MTPTCAVCGTDLVCPKCNPSKKRPLNAQAQAVKACLDIYVQARGPEGINQPFPGEPGPGPVIKWLGTQPIRDGAVKLFEQCCELAVKAHKLDPQFHPFPMTVPKFCQAIPKLNGTWLDGAKANAAKRQDQQPVPKTLSGDGLKRRRCLDALKASGQKCKHDKPFCGDGGCGFEIREELPGKERYSPGPARRTGERFDNPGFKRVGEIAQGMADKTQEGSKE